MNYNSIFVNDAQSHRLINMYEPFMNIYNDFMSVWTEPIINLYLIKWNYHSLWDMEVVRCYEPNLMTHKVITKYIGAPAKSD